MCLIVEIHPLAIHTHIGPPYTLFWVFLIDVFVALCGPSARIVSHSFLWVVRFVNQYPPVWRFPPCAPPNSSSDFSPDQSTAAGFARPEVSTTRQVLSRLQQRHHSTDEEYQELCPSL